MPGRWRSVWAVCRLALELATRYLNYREDLSIPALLQEMESAGEIGALAEFAAEYRDQLPSGHELDVVQTFQMSWEITPEPARQVLRVMGELAPAAVPRSLLRIILDLPAGWSTGRAAQKRQRTGKTIAGGTRYGGRSRSAPADSGLCAASEQGGRCVALRFVRSSDPAGNAESVRQSGCGYDSRTGIAGTACRVSGCNGPSSTRMSSGIC